MCCRRTRCQQTEAVADPALVAFAFFLEAVFVAATGLGSCQRGCCVKIEYQGQLGHEVTDNLLVYAFDSLQAQTSSYTLECAR